MLDKSFLVCYIKVCLKIKQSLIKAFSETTLTFTYTAKVNKNKVRLPRRGNGGNMKVQTKLRGTTYRISGSLQEISDKVSKAMNFTVTPEDIVSQGVWSVVYRHDYAERRPHKTPSGKSIPVQEL